MKSEKHICKFQKHLLINCTASQNITKKKGKPSMRKNRKRYEKQFIKGKKDDQ